MNPESLPSCILILTCIISSALNQVASETISAQFGTVSLISQKDEIPQGARSLTIEESFAIMFELNQMMDSWTILSPTTRGRFSASLQNQGTGSLNSGGGCRKKILVVIKGPQPEKTVETPLGQVGIYAYYNKIPQGWTAFDVSNGIKIQSYLKPLLLTPTSTVCFIVGKMSGSEYGYKIDENYTGECADKFVVRLGNTSDPTHSERSPIGQVGTVGYFDSVPKGWTIFDVKNGIKIKKYLRPLLLTPTSTVCFIPGKMSGSDFGYIIDSNYTGECTDKFVAQLDINPPNIIRNSSIGPLSVISFFDPLSQGWTLLDAPKSFQILQYLKPFLGPLSIICFIPGNIYGSSFGYVINQIYQGECSDKFIIKTSNASGPEYIGRSPLGQVGTVGYFDPIPQNGWTTLDVKNGIIIQQYLKPFLRTATSTVCFMVGKMSGSEYGYNIDTGYKGECLDKFLIKMSNTSDPKPSVQTPLGQVGTSLISMK